MLGECQGAPSRELIRYVPADICTGLRQGMAEGLKKLEDALELARTAVTGEPDESTEATIIKAVMDGVQGYQLFRNHLPFATTFAGDRRGHGENDAFPAEGGQWDEADILTKTFDKRSLADEIDLFRGEAALDVVGGTSGRQPADPATEIKKIKREEWKTIYTRLAPS
jgi:hypothetical protein